VFDGICNLCNGLVRFVIRRDRDRLFSFASLQSQAGQNFVRVCGLDARSTDSILLLKHDSFYIKSDAVLQIAAGLPFPWPLLRIFRFVPRALRDHLYDVIARNRYRWFGKKAECMIPTAAIKNRFME